MQRKPVSARVEDEKKEHVEMRTILIFFRIPSYSTKPLLSRFPVDSIPDGAEVLGFPVLVLEVICMLPSIDTEQWLKLPNNGILVLLAPFCVSIKLAKNMQLGKKSADRVSLDTDLPRFDVLDQPRPSAALNPCQFGIHHLLQVLQSTKRRVNGFPKLTAWWLSSSFATGSKVLPEQAVIDVSSTMEVDDGL